MRFRSDVNTKKTNECFLIKWIRKIVNESEDTWYKILLAKLYAAWELFHFQTQNKIKHLFKWGVIFKVKDRAKNFFRNDDCLYIVPLKIEIKLYGLFRICDI